MILRDLMMENLVENDTEYLYHATYGARMKSIKKFGLVPGKKKNWDDSKQDVIYLATDPDVAYSYAESSDMVSDTMLDDIKVLQIKKSDLDKDKLSIDKNVIDNDGSTLEYSGNIAPDLLKIYEY
jgi:hypothetical protein